MADHQPNSVCDPYTPDFQTRMLEIYRTLRDEHPVYHNETRDFWSSSPAPRR